jgi:hypothetical protein
MQVLEGWEPQEYSHYYDQVDAALTAACQDALGETRTNGRTAFAAYAAVLPDRASALLRRFDSSLQQKLHEAVVAYGKGHAGECILSAHGLYQAFSVRLAVSKTGGLHLWQALPCTAHQHLEHDQPVGSTHQKALVG